MSKAFDESWKKVINKSTFLSTNNYKNNLLNDDSYVYEQSFLQEYLTEKRNIIEKEIEYSGEWFIPTPLFLIYSKSGEIENEKNFKLKLNLLIEYCAVFL